MLVFVSPNSVRSSWVFFEAGFVYARKLRVIPLGFLGLDILIAPAPLNLLQGFNITSEDGLNNIVAVTNEVFEHSHSLSFTAADYREISGLAGSLSQATLGAAGALVYNIESSLQEGEDLRFSVDEPLKRLRTCGNEKE